MRSVVVLPQPDGPSRVTNSRLLMSSEMPRSTGVPSNSFLRSCSSIKLSAKVHHSPDRMQPQTERENGSVWGGNLILLFTPYRELCEMSRKCRDMPKSGRKNKRRRTGRGGRSVLYCERTTIQRGAVNMDERLNASLILFSSLTRRRTYSARPISRGMAAAKTTRSTPGIWPLWHIFCRNIRTSGWMWRRSC